MIVRLFKVKPFRSAAKVGERTLGMGGAMGDDIGLTAKRKQLKGVILKCECNKY